ncbi:apoptosis facilitator Bcl-2-like protein 14 [Protopterus annectens]|uniref:apoptosis facilitator Bcl-2-like protein 14 n=1 Tax=Protopterus annectens TaxID=7888 RepID=UPI001CF967DE|nr:apoptosis facilitator Bcl-2-like protein 14 [Protopterus annectens]XP_043932546.1 apoptosis facilitator Bcl-2-like protein 14 [Protopterus annectens]
MQTHPQILHYSSKYPSLGKEGADKVLEIYVKRSLSLSEGTQKMNCKFKPGSVPLVQPHYRKVTKLGRSLSDFHGYSKNRINKDKAMKINPFTATTPQECTPKSTKDSLGCPQNRSSSEKESKSSRSRKKTPSVFRFFVSLFWKKKDVEKKPNVISPLKPATNNSLDGNAFPENDVCCPSSNETKKKTSIKRVFSLKLNLPQEHRTASPETQASTKCKRKKPTSLPLKDICRPKSVKHCDGDPSADYYEQVSQEIEKIVKQSEPTNEAADRNKALQDAKKQKPPDEDSVDILIQRIVDILKVEGEHINNTINEDETFHKFFKDISYNSFKNLADAYVEHGVNAKVTEVCPEVKKFAFTIDFTAKVAGICSHTVNRIMGFGHQYLQDTFSEFLQFDQELMDNTASPD